MSSLKLVFHVKTARLLGYTVGETCGPWVIGNTTKRDNAAIYKAIYILLHSWVLLNRILPQICKKRFDACPTFNQDLFCCTNRISVKTLPFRFIYAPIKWSIVSALAETPFLPEVSFKLHPPLTLIEKIWKCDGAFTQLIPQWFLKYWEKNLCESGQTVFQKYLRCKIKVLNMRSQQLLETDIKRLKPSIAISLVSENCSSFSPGND